MRRILFESLVRRPLTEEQTRIYISSQFKKAPKLEDAVKRVVLLTLKSPRFLYLGLQPEPPDEFAVAEAEFLVSVVGVIQVDLVPVEHAYLRIPAAQHGSAPTRAAMIDPKPAIERRTRQSF